MNKSSVIPNYLEAVDLKTLRLLMLQNSLAKGGQVIYFDIQYVAKFNKWYAFYNEDAMDYLTGELDGNAK